MKGGNENDGKSEILVIHQYLDFNVKREKKKKKKTSI